MAHPQTAEAVDAPVDDMDSAAAAIDRLMGGDDDPRDEDQPERGDEDQSQDEDDLDLSDDEDGEDDEPETPAIDAPASLTAEEKAAFAALPKEAQKYVTDLEARRAVQVQTATTKASEAQRTAEAATARADAQARAVYANQLKAFADELAPQRPDPALAHTDPATYIALNAQYDAAKAQHDEFVQQVQTLEHEAENSLTQVEMTERGRQLMSYPEFANEQTRETFLAKAEETAKLIGLDVERVAKTATASEIKALRDINEWKVKADKYDAATARQMQRVRDGKKTRTTTPNAAQPRSSESRAYRDAKQHAARTGDVKDAARAIAALG